MKPNESNALKLFMRHAFGRAVDLVDILIDFGMDAESAQRVASTESEKIYTHLQSYICLNAEAAINRDIVKWLKGRRVSKPARRQLKEDAKMSKRAIRSHLVKTGDERQVDRHLSFSNAAIGMDINSYLMLRKDSIFNKQEVYKKLELSIYGQEPGRPGRNTGSFRAMVLPNTTQEIIKPDIHSRATVKPIIKQIVTPTTDNYALSKLAVFMTLRSRKRQDIHNLLEESGLARATIKDLPFTALRVLSSLIIKDIDSHLSSFRGYEALMKLMIAAQQKPSLGYDDLKMLASQIGMDKSAFSEAQVLATFELQDGSLERMVRRHLYNEVARMRHETLAGSDEDKRLDRIEQQLKKFSRGHNLGVRRSNSKFFRPKINLQ